MRSTSPLGFPRPTIAIVLFVQSAIALATFADAGAQTFVDVTPAPLTAVGSGAAWGDYDNDGDVDLYFPSAHKLFRNDAGTFVDVTAPPISTDDGAASLQGIWGDFDGDGDLDLVQAKYSTHDRQFRNDGGSGFVEITSGPFLINGFHWGVASADYDGDGDIDLYFTVNGANKLYRNDGGTFVDATSGPLGDTGSGAGVVWADYDNDRDPDLYFANNSSPNKLLRNDGGTFVDVTTGPLGGGGGGRGCTWGDYDNDGDLDLFLTDESHPNQLLRNDGGGTFVDVTPSAFTGVWNSRSAAWGDYDNDGDLDLYVSNLGGAANFLYRNDGGGSFTNVTTAPLNVAATGQAVSWADYDNDGDLDLNLINASPSSRLFRNDNANGNHWLKVKAIGVASNQHGIGARIVVVAGGVTRIREISAGSGYLAQEPAIAHFGLGSATTITSLQVLWPSGTVQTIPPPAVDQAIQIVEAPPLAVIFDNFDAGGGFHATDNIGAAFASAPFPMAGRAAAKFTVAGGNYHLQSVTLPISTQGSTAGNYLRVRLAVDNGGAPGSTLETLSENQIWPATSNPFTTPTILTSSLHPLLSDGASYWIVTELTSFPGGNPVSVDYRWFLNTNGNQVPFRQQSVSGAGLPSDPWTGFSGGVDVAFRVEGEAVVPLGVDPVMPAVAALAPARPTPFGAMTTLEYSLTRGGAVELAVYDVNGRRLRTLESRDRVAGVHRVAWDCRDDAGREAPPGVYFARLATTEGVFHRRLIKVR